MTEHTLFAYGLSPVATVRIVNRKFEIAVFKDEVLQLEKCIYAFLVGDEIVRIGSSKGKLGKRFRSWQRDVTNALNGKKSSTSDSEAKEWENILDKAGFGTIYARQGTMVTTAVGNFPAYLDEESLLIGKHLPRLNRSKHR